MRPLRLRLQGFTCYADPVEIDFTQLEVFVVAGPTGSGKTTIIDAICYALYGRVPRHSETTSLVSYNRDEMRVELEFQAGDGRWRVSRGINTREVRKRATGQVERSRQVSPVVLEVWTGNDWEPRAGRVADIDRVIETAVGLDYDSFTRCVLLPQGRFDDFLKGDPKQRREILKELLGIEIYDRMMQAANARGRESRSHAENLQRRLQEDFADVSPERLTGLQDELQHLPTRIATAEQERLLASAARGLAEQRTNASNAADQADRKADQKRTEWQQAEAEQATARTALDHLEREIQVAEAAHEALGYDPARHRTLQLACERAEAVLRARDDLASAEKQAADTTVITLAEANLGPAERAVEDKAGRVAAARARIEQADAEIEAASERLSSLGYDPEAHRQLGAAAAIADELDRAEAQLLKLEAAAADDRALKAALAELDQASKALAAARSALTEAETEVDRQRHKNAVAAVQEHLHVGDDCPVCGSKVTKLAPVDTSGLEAAQAALAASQQAVREAEAAERAADQAVHAARTGQERAREAALEQAARCAEARDRLQASLPGGVEPTSSAVATAMKAADELARQYRDLDASLDVLRRNRKSLDLTVMTVNQELREAEQALLQARNQLERARSQVEIARATLAERQSQLAEAERRLAQDLPPGIAPRPDVVMAAFSAVADLADRHARSEAELKQKRQQRESLVSELTAGDRRIAQLKGEESAAREQAAEFRELAAEYGRQLRTAVDGLNVPLIAEALEASSETVALMLGNLVGMRERAIAELMARQTTLAQEVQRVATALERAADLRQELETRSAQAAVYEELGTLLRANNFQDWVIEEALVQLAATASQHLDRLHPRFQLTVQKNEFMVVDSWQGGQVRSVNTVSGGETFVVSLALALAFSERLPELRRSVAARLESLFLDEGFGTLDPETLNTVIEALEGLRSTERMVGIITHVPELKQRIESVIEVIPAPEGSRLRGPGVSTPA